MIRKLMLLLTLSAGTITGFAQKSYNEQVLDYIEKYKTMAIEEQLRSGVPASITLAQGILETSAGQSELCNNASNHFGIKCKNTWTGETYTYTDDAKDECFRKYTSAKISYADHSDFLKNNKRYSNLFQISPTDYAAWAYGLKRCGYATNPQYAKKLIKFIEDYKLQEFTYAALNNNDDEILLAATKKNKVLSRSNTVSTVVPGENIPTNDARFASAKVSQEVDYDAQDEIYVDKAAPRQEEKTGTAVTDYYKTTTKNGVKGFYAKKGDMLLEYAIKNKIRYAKLLEYNDLPDAPLEADMFVYLSRKPKTGKSFTHTVENGETLLQISQDEGIQMEQLLALNHLQKGQEPVPGSVLNLQATSDQVPETYVNAPNVATNNTSGQPRLSNDAGFVPAGKKPENHSVEIADDAEDVVEAPQEKVSTVKKSSDVNIANEPAVEDEIVTTKPAKKQAETKDDKKMSALDKLKAHMDQAVYNENDFQPKATGSYKEESTTTTVANNDAEEPATYVTAPAKKSNTKGTPKTVTPKAVPKSKVKVHTVKKGETLYEIANKYNLTVKELQKMNKITSKNIQPGKKLKVTK